MALALARNWRSEPWMPSPSAVVVTTSKLNAKSIERAGASSFTRTDATCSEVASAEALSEAARERPP